MRNPGSSRPRRTHRLFRGPCTLDFECACWAAGALSVGGVDEAGRGCLAGPVTAAVVVVPRDFAHPTLNDSKQLSASQRDDVYGDLRGDDRLSIAFGMAAVAEIDALNILRASHLAMERAIRSLPVLPDALLIDGLPVNGFPFAHQAVVGGDGLSLSIAAASIIAKVERDRLMIAADEEFQGYGFSRHKGYGTEAHLAALARLGPCALHRRTFAPVRQLRLAL